MTTEKSSVTRSEVAATELEILARFKAGEIAANTVAELLRGSPVPETVRPEASPASVSSLRPEKFRRRNPDLRLTEYIEQYRSEYAGRDPSRLSQLDFWDQKLGNALLTELDDDEIANILDDLASENGKAWRGTDADGAAIFKRRSGKRSPATVNRYLATISAICSFAIKIRSCPKNWNNPCSRVSARPENNQRVRYLTMAEQQRLLTAAKAQKWERMHLLVLMALKTGARRSELLNLRWRDIVWERKTAHLLETKNGDERMLVLLDDVIAELRRFEGAPAGLIFPSKRTPSQPMSFQTIWEKCLKEAGIKDFRFHDVRHTTASMLIQNGVSLFETGAILGHKDSKVTQRYAHLSTDQSAANLRRVFG